MCTWAAVETIDYYLNNGSEVFTCATDMSKAFDMTLHSLMFEKNAECWNGSYPSMITYICLHESAGKCEVER